MDFGRYKTNFSSEVYNNNKEKIGASIRCSVVRERKRNAESLVVSREVTVGLDYRSPTLFFGRLLRKWKCENGRDKPTFGNVDKFTYGLKLVDQFVLLVDHSIAGGLLLHQHLRTTQNTINSTIPQFWRPKNSTSSSRRLIRPAWDVLV